MTIERTLTWPSRLADTDAMPPPENRTPASTMSSAPGTLCGVELADLDVERLGLLAAEGADHEVDVVDEQVPGDAGLDARGVRRVALART